MYVEGEGYQFTLCNNGIGAYILKDKKGNDRDLFYKNLPFSSYALNNVTWGVITSLVD